MLASIQSNGIAQGAGVGGANSTNDSAVALQAQLSRCQRQLGDWEGCESSKTPEGRKIIENLRSRIETLESKMASTGKSAIAGAFSAEPNAAARNSWAAMAQQPMNPAVAGTGSLLNVFV